MSLVQKKPNFLISEIPSSRINEPTTNDKNYFDNFVSFTYKAITTKANAISQYEQILFNKGDVVEDDQLLRDLYRFNGFQTLSEARILSQMHMALTGQAVWIMYDCEVPGYKKEFYILNPLRVKVNTDEYGLPKKYIYEDSQGNENSVEPSQIVIFRNPNPADWLKGHSQLDAVRLAHNVYEQILIANQNLFENDMTPNGIYQLPDGTSPAERKRVERVLASKYGGARNNRKGLVVTGEIEFIQTGMNPKDIDFQKGIELMRDEILSVFGVPKPLVGLTDSTFNNSKEAQRIFQQYTLKPALDLEASVLTEQLIPKYYGKAMPTYYFDSENPVELDRESIVNEITSLVNSGIISKASARQRAIEELGYEDIEDDIVEEPNPIVEENIGDKIATLIHNIESKNAETNSQEAESELLDEQSFGYKTLQMYYFTEQAKRVINSKYKNPTLKMIPDSEEEANIYIDMFNSYVLNAITYFNENANATIQKSLTKVSVKEGFNYIKKGLTTENYKYVAERLSFVAKETNETTMKKITEIIARGMEANLSMLEVKQEIARAYNGFIDGEGNIKKLMDLDVYMPLITLDPTGTVEIISDNRLEEMFKLINSRLTGDAQKEALIALKGMTDYNTPLANQIGNTLDIVFNVQDIPAKITLARTETIAITTMQSMKGYLDKQTYDDNPFVVGYKWLTARDRFVRGTKRGDKYDHKHMEGVEVPKGTPFMVSGEKLDYPGDPKGSAGNIIRCRCTIKPIVSI